MIATVIASKTHITVSSTRGGFRRTIPEVTLSERVLAAEGMSVSILWIASGDSTRSVANGGEKDSVNIGIFRVTVLSDDSALSDGRGTPEFSCRISVATSLGSGRRCKLGC